MQSIKNLNRLGPLSHSAGTDESQGTQGAARIRLSGFRAVPRPFVENQHRLGSARAGALQTFDLHKSVGVKSRFRSFRNVYDGTRDRRIENG
jgi:hypothetical protein